MVNFNIFTTTTIVTILALISNAAANPIAKQAHPVKDYTKVIVTGEGLPTVAELGLTHEDLIKPIDPAVFGQTDKPGLSKRYNPQCYNSYKCSYSDALACYNYLYQLGRQQCYTAPYSRFCYANNCNWIGTVISGQSSASSYCSDVALGGAWVLQNCGNPLAGANAANGNGGLLVSVQV